MICWHFHVLNLTVIMFGLMFCYQRLYFALHLHVVHATLCWAAIFHKDASLFYMQSTCDELRFAVSYVGIQNLEKIGYLLKREYRKIQWVSFWENSSHKIVLWPLSAVKPKIVLGKWKTNFSRTLRTVFLLS